MSVASRAFLRVLIAGIEDGVMAFNAIEGRRGLRAEEEDDRGPDGWVPHVRERKRSDAGRLTGGDRMSARERRAQGWLGSS